MTKADQDAAVPHVDAAARRKLAAALDRDPIAAVYLFGSQATGAAGPLSDVDVAVALSRASRDVTLDVRPDLLAAASEALGTDEVDVVLVDQATPLLRHRVLRDGVLLVERDPRARVRFETRALLDYLDTAPLRETLADGRRARLAEGRFGRR